MERHSNTYVLAIFLTCLLLHSATGWTQELDKALHFRSFGDIYANFYLDELSNLPEPLPFLYNHTAGNQFSTNIIVFEAQWQTSRFRGNLGIMDGDYVQRNLAHERDVFRHFYTANVGFACNKSGTTWLDAGLFESHLGAESLIQQENLTLSRGLAAENSPYYLSGLRLTHSVTDQLQLMFLLVNGWQRMFPAPTVDFPGIGTQIQYTTPNKQTWHYGTYHGQEEINGAVGFRSFHNFFWRQDSLLNRVDLLLGLDFGYQQINEKAGRWVTPQVVARYRMAEALHVFGRVEAFHENTGIFLGAGQRRYQVVGFSSGLSYSAPWLGTVKLSYRLLSSANAPTNPTNFNYTSNNFLMLSYSFVFQTDDILKGLESALNLIP